MSNEYRMVYTTIWTDPAFRQLSESAQRLYLLMLTHPSLSACGVLDWKEAKLAKFAQGMTVATLRRAAYELGQAQFIAVDPETEEALVRSFVRHDGKLKSPNPTRAVVKAYGSIGSLMLMSIVSVEVRRACAEHPDWKGVPFVQEIVKQFPDVNSYPSQMVPDWYAEPFEMSSNSVRNEYEIGSNFDTPKNAEPFEMSSPIRITDKPVTDKPVGGASANAEDAQPAQRRARKTRLPDDWHPTADHEQTAQRLHLDLESEAEDFRNHAQAQGRLLANWDAGFRSWLKKSAEYAQERQGRSGGYRNQAQILQDMRAQAAQATARRQATQAPQGSVLRLIEGSL